MTTTIDFKATVQDADIWYINDYLNLPDYLDVVTDNPTVYVEFELQPEARSWGIKSITPIITRVQTSIEWSVDGEDLTESDKAALTIAGATERRNGTFEGVIEIDTSLQKWEIETNLEFKPDGALSCDAVSIDLKEKTIDIS